MLTQILKYFIFLLLFIVSSNIYAAQFQSLKEFGQNPGQLSASYYQPLSEISNIVVLLHGCGQDAQTLAKNSGFLAQAKRHNTALLLPQQSDSNNIKRCFNWFSPADTDKDSGETLSIINMISQFKSQTNARNIYIAGLSAGGAMTSSLLVHYPYLFKGGAIFSGIPYPCANNLIKAISCMRSGPSNSAQELIDLTKTSHTQWPPLIVWSGNADKIVHPSNARYLATQWKLLSKVSNQVIDTSHQGYRVTQWRSKQQTQIKLVELDDFGHGIPISPAQKDGSKAAPYVIPAKTSSAIETFKFWQLAKTTS